MSPPVSRILSRTTIHLGRRCSPPHAAYPGLDRRAVGVPAWPCSGWGLPAARSPGSLVVSYTTVSPLPVPSRGHRRSVLCCAFRRVAPPGSYPAPCPVESGLSSVSRPRSPGGLTTSFYEPSRFRRPASQPVRPAMTAATSASQITDSVGAGLPPILATNTMSAARRRPVTAPWNRSE